jgi:hypothetical protein
LPFFSYLWGVVTLHTQTKLTKNENNREVIIIDADNAGDCHNVVGAGEGVAA